MNLTLQDFISAILTNYPTAKIGKPFQYSNSFTNVFFPPDPFNAYLVDAAEITGFFAGNFTYSLYGTINEVQLQALVTGDGSRENMLNAVNIIQKKSSPEKNGTTTDILINEIIMSELGEIADTASIALSGWIIPVKIS